LWYVLSWTMFMKWKFFEYQRIMWVFALIVRRHWKHSRPSNQRPNWSINDKRTEWLLCPSCCEVILGPWTCQSKMYWNCRWARKVWFCPKVHNAWSVLGSI
jgi:hypothetical protein